MSVRTMNTLSLGGFALAAFLLAILISVQVVGQPVDAPPVPDVEWVPDGGATVLVAAASDAPPAVTPGEVLVSAAPTHDDELEATSKALLEAVDKGDGWMAAAAILSLLVWLLRFGTGYLSDDGRIGILKRWALSGEGGVVLTLGGAAVTGVITVLAAGTPLGWLWVKTVLKVGLASMGGFVGLKKTLSGEAREARKERKEITGAIKAGAVPAPGGGAP